MLDLHIHSSCSDGSDSPNEILQKSERMGLIAVSITDHDNCDAYNGLDVGLFSGKIITGIEMQAYFKGISIELLGYGFDLEKMREALKGLYLPFDDVNKAELERLYEKCLENGMRFKPGTLENYEKDKYFYATEYLHNEMRKFAENKPLVADEESWAREDIFFKRHTSNSASPFYIDEADLIPSAENVVDIIHKCGGRCFVPHIYQYEEKSDMVLHELVNGYAIDGIECYYPTFTQDQTGRLLGFCKQKGLLVSGGSDYHGNKRKTRLGIDGNIDWL